MAVILINIDIGQIEYIFTDKTGTLTQNIMKFRQCSIGGVVYPCEEIHPDRMLALLPPNEYVIHPAFGCTRFVQDIDRNMEFLIALSLCHTIMTSQNPLTYKAQSPDELAFVDFARSIGVVFLSRTTKGMNLCVYGLERHVQLLAILEFSSARKRMSVLVRMWDGRILLITKGADSVILEQCSRDHISAATSEQLEAFAGDGLRTLCLASRIVEEKEAMEWLTEWTKANNVIDNRDAAADACAAKIEHSFKLLGATAIEDKLGAGVPEAIALLAKADIKIWMLTGDKLETALNIGYSCRLLSRDMLVLMVSASTKDETLRQMLDARHKMSLEPEGTDFALLIDGDALTHALSEQNKDMLLDIACSCMAVICCRVSPLQKALVVKLVKDGLECMCLAIGDGANDVSMIREADIGIGIAGQEGYQAVMTADYAIAQFRFLAKMILVHGRWSYIRTVRLIMSFFLKNITWVLMQF